jgi:hypothetical protein
MQLLANWASWYANQPPCAGFDKAIEMLENEGFDLPSAATRDADKTTSREGAAPTSQGRDGAAGLGVPGLQLQLQLPHLKQLKLQLLQKHQNQQHLNLLLLQQQHLHQLVILVINQLELKHV